MKISLHETQQKLLEALGLSGTQHICSVQLEMNPNELPVLMVERYFIDEAGADALRKQQFVLLAHEAGEVLEEHCDPKLAGDLGHGDGCPLCRKAREKQARDDVDLWLRLTDPINK